MEIAMKRPPEKVLVMHEAPADNSKNALRPPLKVPPKPTVNAAALIFSSQAQPSAQQEEEASSLPPPATPGVKPLTSDLMESLPPLPTSGEPSAIESASIAVTSVDIIRKEDSVSSAAAERIASKYDTSVNATRAVRPVAPAPPPPPPLEAVLASSVERVLHVVPLSSLPPQEVPWQLPQSGDVPVPSVSGQQHRAVGSSMRDARVLVERVLIAGRTTSTLIHHSAAAEEQSSPPQPSAAPQDVPVTAVPFAGTQSTAFDKADDDEQLLPPPPPLDFACDTPSSPGISVQKSPGSGHCSHASSTDSLLVSRDESAGNVQDKSTCSTTTSAGGRPNVRCQPKASTILVQQRNGSPRSCTPPAAMPYGSREESDDALPVVPTETVAVKITRSKIENKRTKAVPRHDQGNEGKKVSFMVTEKQSSEACDVNLCLQQERLSTDERRLRTGLSADEVAQAESFYRSHKTEVRTCQCMATLFFADAAVGSPDAVGVNQWKPEHIGIPVLVYDSGEGKRQRALSFVFAERGTGFQLWRNTMHWQTGYSVVEPTFHRMRVGPPIIISSRRRSAKAAADGVEAAASAVSSVAGIAFQDSECAAQFFAYYEELIAWRPEDNILGDPSVKKKKKKKRDNPNKRQQPLPSKTAISQPVEFSHITQLKRSEDGVVLPAVMPATAHKAGDLPARAIS